MMIIKRKQKFVFLFALIGISIMILLFYSEVKISIFNPKISEVSSPIHFNDPNTFISKHILEMSKKSDIVIFLWDPNSVENDWTGILKSRHLITQEQIDEYLKEKQQQLEQQQQKQQQANSNSSQQQQHTQQHNKNNNNQKDDELYNDNNKCSVSCRFTNIPEEFVESHLVLFDPTYMDKDNWKRSPLKLPEKHKHQKFALMHYGSSSQYPILDNESYNKLMDFNISYKDDPLLDLDVTLACPPNNSFTIEDTAKLLMKKHTDFNDRINSAVFISSNCYDGLSLSRTNLVAQLSQTIPIYSLGKCLNRDYIDLNSNSNNIVNNNNNNNSTNNIKHKEELKNLDSRIQYNMDIYSKYKFTICFENENSTDYITEKVYTALYAGSIPIWMGSKTITKWVPTGSIINANEFNSIRELGLYIADLISGVTDTSKYFKWKELESLESQVYDKLERCVNSVDSKCKLCETISKQLTLEQKQYRTENVMTSLNSYHSHYTSLHLEMKGLGDHIVIDEQHQGIFNFENHYSLMAWVKPSSFSDQRIIDKNLAGTISGFNFDIQKTIDGRGVIRLCAASDCFESFKSIPNDLWTHIAVVFSCNNLDVQKNRVTFFINGEKNSEFENFNPTKINQFPLIIGKSGSRIESLSYDGKIDNIMIFNSSLTSDDIKEILWDKPNLDTYKHKNNLILYYDFDNNPNQIQDSKTSNRYLIRDKSLYKNDGHLQHGKKDDYSEKIISISKEFSFNNKL